MYRDTRWSTNKAIVPKVLYETQVHQNQPLSPASHMHYIYTIGFSMPLDRRYTSSRERASLGVRLYSTPSVYENA